MVVAGSQLGSAASQAEVASRLHQSAGTTGTSSVLDDGAAAGVAATVAAGTSLLVETDASQTASELSSQVALVSSGEDYLAKRQVVPTAATVRSSTIKYTVKSGDTLSSIATDMGITTSTIRWDNGLADGDELKPGQVLSILPTTGVRYKVQPGDTAESIAARFQAVAAQILSFNDAQVSGLVPGQEIVVPDGVKAEAVPAPKAPTVAAAAAVPAKASVRSYFSAGNSYSYGYCTYYVKNRRPDAGSFWGNAANWMSNAKASGFATSSAPAPGWIAWRPWGGGGAGHVAIVEAVNGDGTMVVSDMNGTAGWNRIARETVPVSSYSGFIGY